MTFLGHRLWFYSYHLQGFDTGLSTRDSVQQTHPPGSKYIYQGLTIVNKKIVLVIKYLCNLTNPSGYKHIY